jgi:hypothetical protein
MTEASTGSVLVRFLTALAKARIPPRLIMATGKPAPTQTVIHAAGPRAPRAGISLHHERYTAWMHRTM